MYPTDRGKIGPALIQAGGGVPGPTTTRASLAAQPHTPAGDAAMCALIQQLAETDPERALGFALQERHRRRRTDWLYAALRGWAGVDPEAAVARLATLPAADREGAEGAVLDGAVRRPDTAVVLAQRLMQGEPDAARSHANQLLSAFSRAGDYAAAANFAAALPDTIRAEMLGTAYQYWAQSQPERALAGAMNLPAGETRKAAVDAALSGWAQNDPAGLAEVAMNMTSGEDRTAALQTALRDWVQSDPKAASDWVNRRDPNPELDAGTAAVAVLPQLVARRPETAAGWAETITEPRLRSQTMVCLLHQWAAAQPAAALEYARNSPALLPDDRASLLEALGASPMP